MENNLFVAISDVHISLKNLTVATQVLKQALDKARELKIPLFIAGDLNDTKALMRSEWVEVLIQLFGQEFKDIPIYILVGNHDLNNKNSDQNSLNFLNLIPNVTVIDKTSCLTFGEVEFGVIPYMPTKEGFLAASESIVSKYLLCHQGFMGAFMGDYVVDESSVDPKLLKDFKQVYSGHYHKHQRVEDNIMYFGSPFTVNFGESKQEKFIWVVEKVADGLNAKPILTNVRRHVQFTVEEDTGLKMPDIKPDDLVKIIRKGTKEFALAKINYSYIPSKNITVVPDIVRQSENRISSEIISQPLKVIDTYLESCITDFDKGKLREFLLTIVKDILENNQSNTHRKYKIKSVNGENLLSFLEFSYNYESNGLTLIEGHDEDFDISTGAGKSSFLDIPCYGIFGKTSKDLKADEVVNRKAKKDSWVFVDLEIEGLIYTIKRYRKHKQFENDLFMVLPNGQELRGKDNRETQQLIEETIGETYEIFLRKTYFTQFGAIDQFLSSSDTDKKDLISKITDTQIYDEMVKVIKETIKKLKSKVEDCSYEINTLESAVATLLVKSQQMAQQSEQFELEKKAKIEALTLSVNQFEENKKVELLNLEKNAELWTSKNNLLVQQYQTNSADWIIQDRARTDQIETNIKTLVERKSSLEQQLIIPTAPDWEGQKGDLNSKLKVIGDLEQEISKLRGLIQAESTKKKEFEFEITQKEDSQVGSTCSLCLQSITQEHIATQVRNLNNKISTCEVNLVHWNTKIEEIQQSLKIKPEYETKLNEIRRLEFEFDSKVKASDNISQEIKRVEKDLETNRQQELNKNINPWDLQIEVAQNNLNPVIQQIESKKNETNHFIGRLEEAQLSENPHSNLIAQTNLEIEQKSSLLNMKSGLKASFDKCLEYSLWWKDALHVNIKSYLTDSFLDQVNKIANQYLQEMFDGILSINISATTERGKDTKEKISTTIFNKNYECSYNSLSGGERCRICFALNLAIAKTINKESNIIMFDEVLNGLDDVGKSQVMRVFKQLEAEYETVFVIDHTSEFKSLFTNNIMIKKSNDISMVV